MQNEKILKNIMKQKITKLHIERKVHFFGHLTKNWINAECRYLNLIRNTSTKYYNYIMPLSLESFMYVFFSAFFPIIISSDPSFKQGHSPLNLYLILYNRFSSMNIVKFWQFPPLIQIPKVEVLIPYFLY